MADRYIPDDESRWLFESGGAGDPNQPYYGPASRRFVDRMMRTTPTSASGASDLTSPGPGLPGAAPTIDRGNLRTPDSALADIMRAVDAVRAAGDLQLAADIENAVIQLGAGAAWGFGERRSVPGPQLDWNAHGDEAGKRASLGLDPIGLVVEDGWNNPFFQPIPNWNPNERALDREPHGYWNPKEFGGFPFPMDPHPGPQGPEPESGENAPKQVMTPPDRSATVNIPSSGKPPIPPDKPDGSYGDDAGPSGADELTARLLPSALRTSAHPLKRSAGPGGFQSLDWPSVLLGPAVSIEGDPSADPDPNRPTPTTASRAHDVVTRWRRRPSVGPGVDPPLQALLDTRASRRPFGT